MAHMAASSAPQFCDQCSQALQTWFRRGTPTCEWCGDQASLCMPRPDSGDDTRPVHVWLCRRCFAQGGWQA